MRDWLSTLEPYIVSLWAEVKSIYGYVGLLIAFGSVILSLHFNQPWPTPVALLLIFFLAGHQAYRKALAAKPAIDDGIAVSSRGCHLRLSNCVRCDGETCSVLPTFTVGFHTTVDLINQDQRAVAYGNVMVLGVDSDWKPTKPPKELDVKVSPIDRRSPLGDNPFCLAAAQLARNIVITADIPFAVPDEREAFEYLGSLRRFVVTLGLEQAGQEMQILRFECSAAGIHKAVEQELVQNLERVDRRHTSGVIESLRIFWRAAWLPPQDADQ